MVSRLWKEFKTDSYRAEKEAQGAELARLRKLPPTEDLQIVVRAATPERALAIQEWIQFTMNANKPGGVPPGASTLEVPSLWKRLFGVRSVDVKVEMADTSEEEFLSETAKTCRCCPHCSDSPCPACCAGGVCDEARCTCGDLEAREDDGDDDDGDDAP